MLWSVWISVASLVGSAGPANEVDRLLSAYYEAYRTGTAEELAGFYTDDVVFDDVSQRHHVEGKAPFTEALAGLKNIHVEMNIEEKRRMVSGESVVVEIFYKGTLDCAKLGRPDHENLSYALPAVLLLEVSNGRIRKQTDYIDYRTFTETFAKLQPTPQPHPQDRRRGRRPAREGVGAVPASHPALDSQVFRNILCRSVNTLGRSALKRGC